VAIQISFQLFEHWGNLYVFQAFSQVKQCY